MIDVRNLSLCLLVLATFGVAGESDAPAPVIVAVNVVPKDRDGKLDIVSSQYFVKDGSFAWLKNSGKIDGNWEKYIITADLGPGFGIDYVPDLFGKGRGAFVATNHTNTTDFPESPQSTVVYFDIPDDPRRPWPAVIISRDIFSRTGKIGGNLVSRQFAPGAFRYGDVDGDGEIDITVAGDGDARIFWYKNEGKGKFREIILAGQNIGHPVTAPSEYGQSGGLDVVDFDRDGYREIIVNSWEGNSVNIFEWTSPAIATGSPK